LKPENVLLEVCQDITQVKVADFGTAVQWEAGTEARFFGKVGTLIYMAPEVFTGLYDEKCDVWSCGVILYKLISGRFPFEADDETILRQKLLKGEFDLTSQFWKTKSRELRQLLTGMLQVDPKNRLTASQAVKDEWFQ
jgi:calcium-dependent protein kinase